MTEHRAKARVLNPISYLIVPRFLAMLVMLPALTILGDYVGVLGGWAVCRFALDFNTAGYVLRALESADTWDLYSGMIKARSSPGSSSRSPATPACTWKAAQKGSGAPPPARSCRRSSRCSSATPCSPPFSFSAHESA